jgi:hypothetical protein
MILQAPAASSAADVLFVARSEMWLAGAEIAFEAVVCSLAATAERMFKKKSSWRTWRFHGHPENAQGFQKNAS